MESQKPKKGLTFWTTFFFYNGIKKKEFVVALFNILKKPKGSPPKATTSGVSFLYDKRS